MDTGLLFPLVLLPAVTDADVGGREAEDITLAVELRRRRVTTVGTTILDLESLSPARDSTLTGFFHSEFRTAH